jgi:YfiH family protein
MVDRDVIELAGSDDGAGRHVRLRRLAEAGVRHGFSCRPADPRTRGGGAGQVEALARALGIEDLPRARLRQVHGACVVAAARAVGGAPPAGDALAAPGPGVALTLFTADCVPLLVVDPGRGALAAVHAGWRGTLEGVLAAAIRVLTAEDGARPADLLVGAGPAIRACCYEIGPEVESAFASRYPAFEDWLRPGCGPRRHLDLLAANRAQAVAAGVPAERFLDPAPCTRCRNDLFFSRRADGAGTGRIVTLAAIRR